jgi:glucose/arabinose dehydrogenase
VRLPLLVALLLLACGCAADPPVTDAPSAAAPSPGLVSAPVRVPPGLDSTPFDRPRQALIPAGWTLSLWARVPGARLAAWAPDGTLLVSRPSAGEVLRLVPGPEGPQTSVLLDGLTQPHGLAFAGDTLYVAQSNRVDAYRYGGGAAAGPRPVVGGLPDGSSPELRGAYAHALKSAPGALAGVHGSWNRNPPRAPEVSFFAWRDGTLAAQQTLVGGFQAADGTRWGRPVAAVRGPDGAVYITDDGAGGVYRLAPPAS